MNTTHSILPPSSAGIWGSPNGCTGWVGMAQMYPEPDITDEEAENGTASHEVGESLILKALSPFPPATPLREGDIAANGVVLTDEMVEGATLYANDVKLVFTKKAKAVNLKFGVEDKLSIETIHKECFGTEDSWLYDPLMNELYLWDYKYGHLFVEAFENYQGICYTAGLEMKLRLPKDCKVFIRIVQPRAYGPDGPIREWRTTIGELHMYYGRMVVKAAQAMSPEATLQTGPHCRDCQARHACPPALKAGIGFYEMAAKPIPQNLSTGAMGLQLSIIGRAIDSLTSLKKGFEEEIKFLLKKGNQVPGWSLNPAQGREAWIKPVEEVIGLGALLGFDLSKPTAITPHQARALGVDDATLGAYAAKPNRGFKLVKDDGSKARKAFSYNESILNKGTI